jgi:dCMP deaminase
MYMEMAFTAAKRSYAVRKKVGCIVVTPEEGRFEGINGMPAGFINTCEERVVKCKHSWQRNTFSGTYRCTNGCGEETTEVSGLHEETIDSKTRAECLHAESNAITKIARSHSSSIGATLYCTLSPCLECSKLIIQAGIVRVVYAEQYPYPGHTGEVRALGLELLVEAGIRVVHLPFESTNINTDQQDEGLLHDEEDAYRT